MVYRRRSVTSEHSLIDDTLLSQRLDITTTSKGSSIQGRLTADKLNETSVSLESSTMRGCPEAPRHV